MVQWNAQYQAFTSSSKIIPDGQITASASYEIELEQRLDVTNPAGTGDVYDDANLPGQIGVNNKLQQYFTCGISQKSNQTAAAVPMCAFPLNGDFLDTFQPVEQILLFFAVKNVNLGTVVASSYGPGMLIDISGVSERDVTFDINAGWGNGGAAWGTPIPAESDLKQLLIQGLSVPA
ncbi:hypothetical protein ACFVFQ_31485 [Streptomyces sp. NPDC057743]|uniref:hypothetical protein n=1 Tax=Streptomyces sp. NPDC057743 TaxID=3346236 RepID=UPI00369FBD34